MALQKRMSSALWVGSLEPEMDETYLWSNLGSVYPYITRVHVVRIPSTGQSRGYGFIHFHDTYTARQALQILSHNFPNLAFNWSFGRSTPPRRNVNASYADNDKGNYEYPSLYVGNLDPSVSNSALVHAFRCKFPSTHSAKVIRSHFRDKNFGFVMFRDSRERNRALTNMSGLVVGSFPILVRRNRSNNDANAASAHDKNNMGMRQTFNNFKAKPNNPGLDSCNTTIYIGGFDQPATSQHIVDIASQFGEITSVSVPEGKPFGFVSYRSKRSAMNALGALRGKCLDEEASRPLRVGWARKNYPQATSRGNGGTGVFHNW